MLDPSGAPWRNPADKKDMTGIGLTCAACHTGRFTYKDTAVIIDGGPALTDLLKLKQGISAVPAPHTTDGTRHEDATVTIVVSLKNQPLPRDVVS